MHAAVGETPFSSRVGEVRQAVISERDAVMDVVKSAFKMKSSPGFRHVYAPEIFQPSAWWVAVMDGRMVGAAGFPRRTFHLPEVTLPWAGVTGVATLAEYRGRGIMSTLLRHGIADVDRERLPVSILRGKRHRYGRYGWEEVGRRVGLTLNRAEFPDPGWHTSTPWHIEGAEEGTPDLDKAARRLLAIQRTYLGRTLRSQLEQALMISRFDIHTFWVERGNEAAYAIVGDAKSIALDYRFTPGNEHGSWMKLYELVGEPHLAMELTGHLLRDGRGQLESLVSTNPNPIERILYERADRYFVAPFGMVRIHNLTALLEAYAPWLGTGHAPRPRRSDAVVLTLEGDESGPEQSVAVEWNTSGFHVSSEISKERRRPIIRAGRRAWAQAIFGPLDVTAVFHDSSEAWRLKDIFPLPLSPARLELV